MRSIFAERKKKPKHSLEYTTIQNNTIDTNMLIYECSFWGFFAHLTALSFSTASVICYCILTRVKTSSCSTMCSKALPREGEMPVCLSTLCTADSLSFSDSLFELVAKTEAGRYCRSSLLT